MQYFITVPYDTSLVNVETLPTVYPASPLNGLAVRAVNTTTGAPSIITTAGKFIRSATIYNAFSGVMYLNEGTVASPVWNAVEAGSIPDGSVTTAKLADHAVTGKKVVATLIYSVEAAGLATPGNITGLTGVGTGDVLIQALNETTGALNETSYFATSANGTGSLAQTSALDLSTSIYRFTFLSQQ